MKVALILAVRDGERVSAAIAREADRIGVASMDLLAMTVGELRRLRREADEKRCWRDAGVNVREVPDERAARCRELLRTIQGAKP